MAGQSGRRRPQHGTTQLTATLLVLATVVLAALVALALISWFGRMP